MEHLIFLDFDGVINNNIDKITVEAIMTLKELIKEYQAKVVVISSLLGSGTIKKRRMLTIYLNRLGIYDIDFIDPNFEGTFLDKKIYSRALGIVDYLKNHVDSSYVILDDEFHNTYHRLGLNYFRTDGNKGLQHKDLKSITFKKTDIRALEIPKYHYRTLIGYEKAMNDLVRVLKQR